MPIRSSRRSGRPQVEKPRDEEDDAGGLSRFGFRAAWVAVIIMIAAIVSGLLISRSTSEYGAFVALVLASAAGGSFAGFLVGAPGLGSGDEEQQKANERGWADRLGVFGNWVTGAAFVLVVANGAELAGWFSSMTATIARRDGGHSDVLYQYSLGAWMIAAASLGFTVGFMQMVTTGRGLIGAAHKAEAAANAAQAAAEEAAQSAEAARAGPVH